MRVSTIILLASMTSWLPASAQQIPLRALEEPKDEHCIPPSKFDEPHVVYIYTHIDTIGHTGKSAVVKSSGIPLLDNAAITCLQTKVIGPARQNDKPIEFDWIVQIRWPGKGEQGHLVLPNPSTGDSNNCLELARQVNEKMDGRHLQGQTRAKIHITDDGSVEDPSILESSGEAKLDELSLTCLRKYKYFPGYQEKKKIPFEWSVNNNWLFR